MTVYELPSRKAQRQWMVLGGAVLSLVALTVALRVNPLDLITQFHHIADLADRMFPPHTAVLWDWTLWSSIVETLAMAVFGSIVGGSLALLTGLLAAANTTPHPAIRRLIRAAISVERAVTAFFILMILLVALGIGPLATAITLVLSTIGVFGRLFADAIEQAEPLPCEALVATGASPLQVVVFGVLPQVLPALLGLALFAFEVNLRAAITLGIFGGGGLGFQLHVANGALRYRDVLGYALMTILLVTLVERASDAIRRRLLQPA